MTTAAFFPTLSLSSTDGYQNSVLPGLLDIPNRFWSLGPSLAMTLLDFGARAAATDQAVATYRQKVLAAFQNVEDNFVTLRLLEDETRAQEAAVKYARDAVRMTLNQYKSGVVSYLNMVTAQATTLSNERTLLTLISLRLSSHVALVKALGVGWQVPKV
ncbi:MAG: TolC family protein [Candidatus Protistobacter heckmanni]|nr:TolC family protein [Candidatus Protistobacter heckmanni]